MNLVCQYRKNVDDLENAPDTLRTENEALKRELSSCTNFLYVVENFIHHNNITEEQLKNWCDQAVSSSDIYRDFHGRELMLSMRDSIQATEKLTETSTTAQLKQEVGLLCDLLKKLSLAEYSSLTSEEKLKLAEMLQKRPTNEETEKKKTTKDTLPLI